MSPRRQPEKNTQADRPQRGIVVVTGSSGFLGAPLAERLAAEGYTVVGFDRSGPPHPPTVAECVCMDVQSDDSVRAALDRLRYAYGDEIASVVHLAAFYDFSGEESPLYERITVKGTERLLRGLAEFDVGQFVFSSTALVHAPCQPSERVDEDWPLEPKWAYPQSKVRSEAVIRRERGDAPSVVLRIAGVYTDRCQSIPLAHQIQRIHERRLVSHVFPGDTSHGQPFVHLDDVLDAIVAAVKRRRDLPEETVLLVGEEETLSYDTLQREFGRLLHGEEWETRQIPKALAKTGAWLQDAVPGEEPFIKPWMIDLADDHMELDVSRARKLLGWSPQRSLRDTLPKMIAALKEDADAWYGANKLSPSSRVAPEAHKHPEQRGSETGGHGGDRKAPSKKEDTSSSPQRHEAHTHEPTGGKRAESSLEGDAAELSRTGDMTAMTREMRGPWLWTNFAVVALGLWLASSPFTFGYERETAMCASDVISGLLLALSAGLAVHPRFDTWCRWAVAAIGTWLQAAPLLLWAASPAAYLNDTLVGALAITLSILVPMMPGMAHHHVMEKPGPEIPPGWSYNPSSWHQRAPMIALALMGWLVSRLLAARQLGYIDRAWEPFFGEGTERVLTSDVSQMWPISDAGLGAFAYTFEMLMGCMGATTRWRTMPWMVTFFFILVVPLGLAHIVLVILQPLVVGFWCTLCLTAAFLMLLMIPLAVDEVIAMSQFLRRTAREGRPLWRTFWVGGTLDERNDDERTPEYGAPLGETTRAMFWGVSVPWTLLVSAALGLWLMFAPAVFGTGGSSADQDHLVGALVLTIAAISTAEVVRAGRWLNVLLGLWLIAGQWTFAGASTFARVSDLVVGLAVVLLSLPRGAVRERYAAWQRLIR